MDWAIAKRMAINGRWTAYLSPDEGRIFLQAIGNESSWNAFLQNPSSLADPSDSWSSFPPSAFPSEHSSAAAIQLASFRIRAMLSEQLMFKLYGSEWVSAVINPQEDDDMIILQHSNADLDSSQDPPTTTRELNGADAEPSVETNQNVHQGDQPAIVTAKSDQEGDATTSSGEVPTGDTFATVVPIDDMYYSLEYDLEAIRLANEAMAIKEAIEEKETPNVVDRTSASSIVQKEEMQKPSEEVPGLQYLFEVIKQAIEPEKAKEMKITIEKLKQSRSKWAHDYRIGQEQLYEALERTLNDLKNYSVGLPATLNKRDVPDYYDIIKKPMDLGTMTKKLQALQYNSKEEFAEDLYQIWANCLIYNTAPDSIYRKKAYAMKKRTTELLKKVPDIKIEIKPHEESDSDGDDNDAPPEEEEKPELVGSRSFPASRPDGAETSGKMRKSSSSAPSISEAGDPNADLASMFDIDNATSSIGDGKGDHKGDEKGDTTMSMDDNNSIKAADIDNELDSVNSMAGKHPLKTSGPQDQSSTDKDSKYDELENEIEKELGIDVMEPDDKEVKSEYMEEVTAATNTLDQVDDFTEEPDLQTKKWMHATIDTRIDIWKQRESQSNLPFPERTAVKRKKEDYQVFLENTDAYARKNSRRRLALSGHHVEPNMGSDTIPSGFLPELLHPHTSLPRMAPHDLAQLPWKIDGSPPSLSEYDEIVPQNHSKMRSAIVRNILQLKQIRTVYSKICGQANAEDVGSLKRIDVYRKNKDLHEKPKLVIGEPAAESVLKQITGQMLAHSGFDSSQSAALCLLTDIGIQYFLNLGKTLRLYLDKYQSKMSFESILLLALQANGVNEPSELDQYIKGDIIRYGLKLYDTKRRLDSAYKFMQASSGDNAGEDINLDEMGDYFASGNLFEDLGVDFMNFKDLGLDVDMIPMELWNRKADKPIKLKKFAQKSKDENGESVDGVVVKPTLPWQPIKPQAVIGLLRPFYEGRKDEDMVEDEERKNKYHKSKALLKIALVGRKKLVLASDAAKNAKATDPAKIAEKAAKEAAKKKREAEKAEKLKLREEQKQLAKKKTVKT
ncbi:Transcriptional activator spt7 [Chytridiales sp. JEL 0842]|nr:Transcriptional activator spt7 [Chytridiales sp. JEL 0842]